jgi:hypothetical protein
LDNALLLKDYEKAVVNIKHALEYDHNTDLEKAGCIKYFEFCFFEIAWKGVKAISEEMGMDSGSPKTALKK